MTNSADSDQKPTDLDLHCFQMQGISGFSRTRIKVFASAYQSPNKSPIPKNVMILIFLKYISFFFLSAIFWKIRIYISLCQLILPRESKLLITGKMLWLIAKYL